MILRVHFDQNCMNARGTDPELERVQRLHDAGDIELAANRRHYMELGDGHYASAATKRLRQLPQTSEFPRWGWSGDRRGDGELPWDAAPNAVSATKVWDTIFPGQKPPDSLAIYGGGPINSLHDVMHVVNAHEAGADVFLTRDDAIVPARERLYSEVGLRPRIERPSEFLLRFPSSSQDQP